MWTLHSTDFSSVGPDLTETTTTTTKHCMSQIRVYPFCHRTLYIYFRNQKLIEFLTVSAKSCGSCKDSKTLWFRFCLIFTCAKMFTPNESVSFLNSLFFLLFCNCCLRLFSSTSYFSLETNRYHLYYHISSISGCVCLPKYISRAFFYSTLIGIHFILFCIFIVWGL